MGDTVKQKCGGPSMTVVSIDLAYPCKDGSLGGLFCLWEIDNLLFKDVFWPFALDLLHQGSRGRGDVERCQLQR